MATLAETAILCCAGTAADTDEKVLTFDRDRNLCHIPLVGQMGRAITHEEALAILTCDPAVVCDYLDRLDEDGTINWRLAIDAGRTYIDEKGVERPEERSTLASCCASGSLTVIEVPWVNDRPDDWEPEEGMEWARDYVPPPTLREDIDRYETEPTRLAIMSWLLDRDPEAAWADYSFDPTARYLENQNLPYHSITTAQMTSKLVFEAMLMHASADKYIADEMFEWNGIGLIPVDMGKLKQEAAKHIQEGYVDKDVAEDGDRMVDDLISLRERTRCGAEQATLEAVIEHCTNSSSHLSRGGLDGFLGDARDYEHFIDRRLRVRDPSLSDNPLQALAGQPNVHDMTWASFARVPDTGRKPWHLDNIPEPLWKVNQRKWLEAQAKDLDSTAEPDSDPDSDPWALAVFPQECVAIHDGMEVSVAGAGDVTLNGVYIAVPGAEPDEFWFAKDSNTSESYGAFIWCADGSWYVGFIFWCEASGEWQVDTEKDSYHYFLEEGRQLSASHLPVGGPGNSWISWWSGVESNLQINTSEGEPLRRYIPEEEDT